MPESNFARISALPSEPAPALGHRSIGKILQHDGILNDKDVAEILACQARSGLSFGEAALQLGLLNQSALSRALARQFDYAFLQDTSDVSAEVVTAYQPFSELAEQMRSLRTQLLTMRAASSSPRTTLALASAHAGEGRSFIAANLAVVFSQMGERTLLIDADLRAPRQHALFNLPAHQGLSTLLMGRGDDDAICRISALDNLSVLPAGPLSPNPQELLCKPEFQRLLNDFASRYDFVIIDTPAFDHAADAQLVATRADSLLLIARPGSTSIPTFRNLCARLAAPLQDACTILINNHQPTLAYRLLSRVKRRSLRGPAGVQMSARNKR